MNFDKIEHIASLSGGVFWIMLLLLLFELTVIVERLWYLTRTVRRGGALSASLDESSGLEKKQLEALADSSRGPQGEVIRGFLHYCDEPSLNVGQMDELLDEVILKQQPVLNERIWILDTIVTLGPLLGLFGTIIGMFETFSVLGAIQTGGATNQVSGGIAAALVTTGQGIFIACLGLIFFNGINNRVRYVMHQMEAIKVTLINRLMLRRSNGNAMAHHYDLKEKEPLTAGGHLF